MIWLVYVGFGRPIDLGPLPIRVTLVAVVGPLLLWRLNRLRTAPVGDDVRQALNVTLGLGIGTYLAGLVFARPAVLLYAVGMVRPWWPSRSPWSG